MGIWKIQNPEPELEYDQEGSMITCCFTSADKVEEKRTAGNLSICSCSAPTQFLVLVTSAVTNVKGHVDPEPVWQLTNRLLLMMMMTLYILFKLNFMDLVY